MIHFRQKTGGLFNSDHIGVWFLLFIGLFDYQIRIRIHNEFEPKVNPTHI